MKFRMMTATGMILALTGCATTGVGDPIEARWNGQPAGAFFAAYGPPIGDTEQGSSTVYAWRGGFKTVRIPAKYAEGDNGKKGKQIAPARTASLSCQVKLTVGADYLIRNIETVVDKPGINGPSYCAEFLDGKK